MRSLLIDNSFVFWTTSTVLIWFSIGATLAHINHLKKLIMSFNGNEGSFISLNDAADLTENFRSTYSTAIKGNFIGKNKIADLLAQSDAMGLRIYNGITAMGAGTIVVVAADSSTDDILDAMGPLILDQALPCPAYCGASNDLNS
jgi:hypothetical protein